MKIKEHLLRDSSDHSRGRELSPPAAAKETYNHTLLLDATESVASLTGNRETRTGAFTNKPDSRAQQRERGRENVDRLLPLPAVPWRISKQPSLPLCISNSCTTNHKTEQHNNVAQKKENIKYLDFAL